MTPIKTFADLAHSFSEGELNQAEKRIMMFDHISNKAFVSGESVILDLCKRYNIKLTYLTEQWMLKDLKMVTYDWRGKGKCATVLFETFEDNTFIPADASDIMLKLFKMIWRKYTRGDVQFGCV
jgi:hypothetical protein